MEEDIEFHKIGKNTTHKVPEGFFETISEKTLQKAKQREEKYHKRLVLWKTMTMAASIAAVISIGYLIFSPGIHMDSKQIVLDKRPVEKLIVRQESIKQKTVPQKAIAGANTSEVLGDVLHDLSDEELLEIATVYNADPFIGGSEQ
jgi:hypothetical protein